VPPSLTFVPLDFEHQTLAEGLAEAGFDARRRVFRLAGGGSLPDAEGISRDAGAIGNCRRGSGVSFDYALSPETLSPLGRWHLMRWPDGLRLRASRSSFSLRRRAGTGVAAAGFHRVEQLDYEQLNELYFKDRADGLKLSAVGLAMLATAWV
jgi:O-methyltransferase involved in polyketide biosynthesis